jgi:hypothetical protein
MRNFRKQCCGCGLIHRLDFRLVDRPIEFRTRRDNRATAASVETLKDGDDDHHHYHPCTMLGDIIVNTDREEAGSSKE